jgi:hypothetical protein
MAHFIMENKIYKLVRFKNKLGNVHAMIVKITTTDTEYSELSTV